MRVAKVVSLTGGAAHTHSLDDCGRHWRVAVNDGSVENLSNAFRANPNRSLNRMARPFKFVGHGLRYQSHLPEALCTTSGKLFVAPRVPPADVVVRYDAALMDPCNRQFNCLISSFLRVGKISIDTERARFTITVRDIGCRSKSTAFCGRNDRTDQATAVLNVFRLHSASR